MDFTDNKRVSFTASVLGRAGRIEVCFSQVVKLGFACMSAVEMAIEKVKALPEAKAKVLLDWLAELDRPNHPASAKGIMAVRGVARKFHAQPLTTNEWMKILREGEQ
jgi:hypothetical protein